VQRADRREHLIAAERLVAGGEVVRHAEAELALGCPHRHVLAARWAARASIVTGASLAVDEPGHSPRSPPYLR
jgi:hypothetical protein